MRQIGRFDVLECLGVGGMGAVYRVRDPHSGRELALKRLRPNGSMGRDGALRLRREFRAIARLQNPRIVQVYEFGTTADGAAYYTMELLSRSTLAQVMAPLSGRQRLERSVILAREIAAALSYLHGAGVIHRDLKPENVLVDDDGGVKLMDFGLARDLQRAATVRLTPDGATLGTALYIAPEQARGFEVDHRADLYSLGAVMYEMIAGVPPFTDTSVLALIFKHVQEDPRALSELCPQAPARLEQLVMQLLRKDPYERPQSADDVLAALHQLPTVASGGSESEATRVMSYTPTPATSSAYALNPAPLVGRRAELAALLSLTRRSCRPPARGGVAVVSAGAGLGKSRLLAEVRGHPELAQFASCMLRLQPADQRVPYRAVARLLCLLADDATAAEHQRAADTLRRVATGEPDLEVSAPRVAAAATELARVFTARRPLLVLVDDAHWLDSCSARVIEALADLSTSSPLYAIVSQQPGTHCCGRALVKRMLQGPGSLELPLRPLSSADVQSLAAYMLGRQQTAGRGDPPPALVHRLFRRSGGNPLAVQELLRAMIETGALAWTGEGWRIAVRRQSEEDRERPETLSEAVGRRARCLSTDANQVLAFAAAMGEEVAFADLKLATGFDEGRLLDIVNELINGGFLRAAAGAERYGLRNAAVADAVLGSLSAADRAALHRRIAEALATHQSREDLPFLLSYHFDRAGDRRSAVRYAVEAGRRAEHRHAYREAGECYQRALQLLGDRAEASARAKLRLALMRCQVARGSGRAALDVGRGLTEQLGPGEPRARAELRTAQALGLRGWHDAAFSRLERALGELGQRLPRSWLGLLLSVLFGWLRRLTVPLIRRRVGPDSLELTHTVYNEMLDALHVIDRPHHRLLRGAIYWRATGVADALATPRARAEAALLRAVASAELGMWGWRRRAQRQLQRSARLTVEFGDDPRSLARLTLHTALLLRLDGRYDDAVEHLEAALEHARRAGDRRGALVAARLTLELAIARGELALATRHHARVRHLAATAEDAGMSAQLLALEAVWRNLAGQSKDADSALGDARKRSAASPNPATRLICALAEAWVSNWRGDFDHAVEQARAAAAPGRGRLAWFAGALPAIAEAYAHIGLGDATSSASCLRRLPRRARKHPLLGGERLLLCAHIAALRGNGETALQLARRAYRWFQRCKARLGQARALALRAALQGDAGLGAQARQSLQALGMGRSVLRVQQQLCDAAANAAGALEREPSAGRIRRVTQATRAALARGYSSSDQLARASTGRIAIP